ncbi:MAG: hypothetical protein J5627_01945 [Bacilli bacterium]|nr:hypothetical protein [Bacilli bacterium]
MQKPVKLFLSLLCLPVLFSCGKGGLPSNYDNRMEVMMTLEHASCFKEDYSHFSGIGHATNAEDIIYRVENGENVLFAFTKEDCSSCEDFLKHAGRYIYRTHYRFSYIQDSTKEAADKISKYAVENKLERTLAHPISGGTPSMYIMSKERIVELIYGSNNNDEAKITTAFGEYLNDSNVHHSKLYRWLMLAKQSVQVLGKNNPTYVLSETSKDDFYKNIYPIVSKSKKQFNVLEIGSEDYGSRDLENLYEEVGTEEIEGKLLKIERVDAESEEANTKISIIDDTEAYLKENYPSSSL